MPYLMKLMFAEVVVRLPNLLAGLCLSWSHNIGGYDDLNLMLSIDDSFKLTWMEKNLVSDMSVVQNKWQLMLVYMQTLFYSK